MTEITAEEGGRRASAATVLAKERVPLTVPTIPLEGIETLVPGLRASVIETRDGSVMTHGGFGSRFAVSMTWKGRHATIDAIDLLAAWVATFAPEDAEAIRRASITVDKTETVYRTACARCDTDVVPEDSISCMECDKFFCDNCFDTNEPDDCRAHGGGS